MRVVIWIVVIFLGAFIKTVVFGNEPMGAIPAFIFYGAVFSAATALSSLWSKREKKDANANMPTQRAGYFNSSDDGVLNESHAAENRSDYLRNSTQVDINMNNDSVDIEALGKGLVSVDEKLDELPLSSEETEQSTKDDDSVAIPPIRFCRKCGFQLLDDSSFCSHCGTKVIEANIHEVS